MTSARRRPKRIAHARVYGAQADGVGIQNGAARSLPEMFASLLPQARPEPPPTLDGFLSPDHQLPGPQEAPDEAFRRGLPAVIAALAQAQGDKVDTSETIGGLASFLGGDELARRGLIAQGHTPTEDFAVTPDRADEIAGNKASAALRQALGVAGINHSNDIPVANIRAGSVRDAAMINNRDDVTVANIAAGSRENVAAIKGQGTPVADGRAIVSSIYPGARITVIEALDESGPNRPAHATGANWHVVLGQPGAGRGAKPAKVVQASAADVKLIDAELDAQLATRGWADKPAVKAARNMLRNRAVSALQATGNPVGAVGKALNSIKIADRRTAAAEARPKPASVPGAVRAPDGRWVVKKNGQWFEVVS